MGTKMDYRTDMALVEAYSKHHNEPDNIVAHFKTVYIPHIWRGGRVIPGFGYSTQRIENGFVTAENAGSWEAAIEYKGNGRGK